MKISALKGKQRTIFVTVPGGDDEPDEKVKIVYRPGAVDIEMAESIEEVVNAGLADVKIAFVMLEPLLVSWDLTDDEGNEWGTDRDSIKKIPLSFLGLVLAGIHEDSRPNPQRQEISVDGSPQEEKQDGSLTGTSSSEQQIDSDVERGSSLISQ